MDDDASIALGYDLSLRFGCSFDDATYLALAESLNSPFVCADQRLRNALGPSFPLAVLVDRLHGSVAAGMDRAKPLDAMSVPAAA